MLKLYLDIIMGRQLE